MWEFVEQGIDVLLLFEAVTLYELAVRVFV